MRKSTILLLLTLSLPVTAAQNLYPNSLSLEKPKPVKTQTKKVEPKKEEKKEKTIPALPPPDHEPGAYTRIRLEDIFYKPHLDTGYEPIKLEASLTESISVDLEYVLVKALEDNLNLNISRENTSIAKWQFWQQFSEALPDFIFAARKKSLDGTIFFSSNLQIPVNQDQAQTQFRISHRAFNGGKTTFLTIAEHYYKSAAGQDEQEQYNLVLLKSLEHYNNLLRDQVKLSTKMKSLEEAQSNFGQASKFLKAGTGTKFDVLQAEARMARVQQQMVDQEAQFRMSEINLAEHLNLPLSTPLHAIEDETAGIRKLNLIPADLTIDNFLETARKFNPRVIASMKRKNAAGQQSLSNYGDLLPKLDIYADWSATGLEFDNLNSITTLGVEATLEFGQGSGVSTFSSIMQGKALARKAKLLYEQEQQRIEKELRTAFLNFEKAKSVMHATEIELKASREALHLSRLRYENGIEILANVLERERDLADVESYAIDSIAAYNLAQAQLLYLMGTISIKDLLAVTL